MSTWATDLMVRTALLDETREFATALRITIPRKHTPTNDTMRTALSEAAFEVVEASLRAPARRKAVREARVDPKIQKKMALKLRRIVHGESPPDAVAETMHRVYLEGRVFD